MSESRITATELAKSLSDVLSRVHYRGEEFVIERNGEPVAALSPVKHPMGITLQELAAKLSEIPSPGEDFADDLEAIRESQPKLETPKWLN